MSLNGRKMYFLYILNTRHAGAFIVLNFDRKINLERLKNIHHKIMKEKLAKGALKMVNVGNEPARNNRKERIFGHKINLERPDCTYPIGGSVSIQRSVPQPPKQGGFSAFSRLLCHLETRPFNHG
jgi:hypothetical protein